MDDQELERVRFPVGRFEVVRSLSAVARSAAIDTLRAAPSALTGAVAGLDDAQLDTTYREGGWTVRQVVHHLADSTINGYVRLRWAMTEDGPTIKPYDQKRWAELHDARTAPIADSLALFAGTLTRMTALLETLDDEAVQRTWAHPDGTSATIDTMIALYAWHVRHHTAHITELRGRRGW